MKLLCLIFVCVYLSLLCRILCILFVTGEPVVAFYDRQNHDVCMIVCLVDQSLICCCKYCQVLLLFSSENSLVCCKYVPQTLIVHAILTRIKDHVSV